VAGRSSTARSLTWALAALHDAASLLDADGGEIHDLTFLTNPEWHERSKVPFFRRAIAYAATHADVLVTISEFTARQLDEQVPEHAPVVVATLGVDLERFSADSSGDAELLRALGLAAERPTYSSWDFEPRKGIDVLLDAFEEIARRDDDVELWLAGQPAGA